MESSDALAVQVSSLRKVYGNVLAGDDVSFEVALAMFVSYITFAALGMAFTARIRSTRAALELVLAVSAPMFVLSGAFGPRKSFPETLHSWATGCRLPTPAIRSRSSGWAKPR